MLSAARYADAVTSFARPRQGTHAQGVDTHRGLDLVKRIFCLPLAGFLLSVSVEAEPLKPALHLVHHDPGGSIFRFLGA